MHQGTDLRTDLAKAEGHEENDFFYTKERSNYVSWARILGFLAIVVAIAAIVLNSIHIARYSYSFIITLLIASVVFFLASVLVVVWANRLNKTYGTTDIYQPRTEDALTKGVFILSLILAGAAAALMPNLYLQSEYSADWTRAQSTNKQTWDAVFEGSNEEDINTYFRHNFIIQSIFVGFFFLFFLVSARAAFRCLKWDNQAMSYVVFLANTFFLFFGFAILFYGNHAFGYGDYPQIRAHFPVWNTRSLYVLGLSIVVLSFITFFIDHRSWRVGFFVLSFLLLLILIALVNFTGYAYRHTRQTYEYYKGVQDINNCVERIGYVHRSELEDLGCPAKYTAAGGCANPTTNWENPPSGSTPNSFCLNGNCCGLMGRAYTEDLLSLANYSFLAFIAGCFVSIGCYYFWYVSWVDTSRDKKKDYIWLVLMGIITVAFFAVFFAVDMEHVAEKVSATGEHY